MNDDAANGGRSSSRTRDQVAEEMADAHYSAEPGITKIYRLVPDASEEESQEEPIKLLEVNRDTVPVGIEPVFLGTHPASGAIYPSVVVAITPEEFGRQEILSDLQNRFGWKVGRLLRRRRRARREG